MIRSLFLWIGLLFLLLLTTGPIVASQISNGEQILTLIQKMEATLKKVQDYSCEVEQTFYRGDEEEERYRFNYYFKRGKGIRVDFQSPYPTLSLFYTDGEKEVTVMPFRPLPLITFRLSVDHPKIRTLTGQKLNQTDMNYFIRFLFENVKKVPQGDEPVEEDERRMIFWFQALDYIRGKTIEKYRITLSKELWFPIQIERYTLNERRLEKSLIKNYTINSHLEDKLFIP